MENEKPELKDDDIKKIKRYSVNQFGEVVNVVYENEE